MNQTTISLTFVLNEEVTPDLFAARVFATLVQHNTLRVGEGMLIPSTTQLVIRK